MRTFFWCKRKKSSSFCLYMCAEPPNLVFFVSSHASAGESARKHEKKSKSARKHDAKNWWRAFFDELRATSETLLFLVHVLSGEKMAQRSPRKSLQLNRANTPINFNGPMQDVNVSGSFFIKKERAGSKTCARALFVKSLSFTLAVKNLAFSPRVKTSRY